MIRKYYRFYGQVQGVGFRARAKYAAWKFGITGWVKNHYDGSVEMEAQGSTENLDKLVHWLDSEPWIDIERIDSKEIALEPGSSVFEIRRGY